MKNLLIVSVLAVLMTALTTGFTTSLRLQEAIGKAAMGAVPSAKLWWPSPAGKYPNIYIRIVRVSDGQQWDTTAKSGAGGLVSQATYANTAKALTRDTYACGVFESFSYLPEGTYGVTGHNSATPADTDEILAAWRVVTNGNGRIEVYEVN